MMKKTEFEKAMSSVIVLDSSDEDEVPTKKPYLPPSIPATITPIKTDAVSARATNGTSTILSANILKHKKPNARTLPSGITITRRSPINVVASTSNKLITTAVSKTVTNANISAKIAPATGRNAAPATHVSTSSAYPTSNNRSAPRATTSKPNNSSAIRPAIISDNSVSTPLLRPGATSSNAVPALHVGGPSSSIAATSRASAIPTNSGYGTNRTPISTSAATYTKATLSHSDSFQVIGNSNSKPMLPVLPKINAAFSLGNPADNKALAPLLQVPQGQTQQQQQSHQQQTQLPQFSQMPQLQPSPSVLRKHLTNIATRSPPQLHSQQSLQQQQAPLRGHTQQPSKAQQQLQKAQQQQQLQQQHQQLQQQKQPTSGHHQQPQAKQWQSPPKQHQFVQRQLQQQPPAPKQQQFQFQSIPKQQQQSTYNNTSGTTAAVSNTKHTAASTLVPIISTVQSMAASATPPLQLLATPPHSAATSFNEQLLFSPELRNAASNLPPSTTVISMPPLSELSFNNNNNNTNNNFKIQLPSKRSNTSSNSSSSPSPTITVLPKTSSSAISPVSTLSVTPVSKQPSYANGTTKVNTIAPSTPTPTNICTSNNTKMAAITPPVTPTTILSSTTVTPVVKPPIKRIKPITVMSSNDESWLKRSHTAMSSNDDVVVVELPLKPSASSPKQIQSAFARVKEDVRSAHSPGPQTPTPPGVKKSAKIRAPSTVDLTNDPEKPTVSNVTLKTTGQKSCESGSGELFSQSSKSDKSTSELNGSTKTLKEQRAKLQPEYEELLKICREADSSDDMDKLVKTKMLKYYYNVHPEFVRSKGFLKSLHTVTENIRREPDLVYVHLKTIVDELKVRMISKKTTVDEEPVQEEVASNNTEQSFCKTTGNKHTDEQIKKLNKALYIITRRIAVLDEAEVDWDDDDSNYIKSERFKKRACQIHQKLCELTGESRNAHRLAKKPVHFNESPYTEFNKMLGSFINRTKEFPDYYDVLRMLEHCNEKFDYDLAHFELKRIAHDSFVKVGKLLQSRRQTDLYETVAHYTANEKDPATIDPTLQAKLSENSKKQTRISEVIEKYARKQDMIADEAREARLRAKSAKNGSSEDDTDTNAYTNVDPAYENKEDKIVKKGVSADDEMPKEIKDDDNDEDDDEDDMEDDDADIEADVEKLANGEISDVESDVEIVVNSLSESLVASERKQSNGKSLEEQTNDRSESLAVVASTSSAVIAANKSKNEPFATPKLDVCDSIMKPSLALLNPGNMTVKITATETATTMATSTMNVSNKPRGAETVDTVDPLQITSTKLESKKLLKPNGRVKMNDNNVITTCFAGLTVDSKLKIVSVSSLREKICIDDQNISNEKESLSTAQVCSTLGGKSSSIKEGKQLQRQQAVAEIVISDEES